MSIASRIFSTGGEQDPQSVNPEALGWQLTPIRTTNPYFQRWNMAKRRCAAAGLSPTSAVFITEVLEELDEFGEAGQRPQRLPRVCEVFAEYAAKFMANRTHRLSTQEEVDRFYTEQRERDIALRAINETQRHEQTLRVSPAWLAAAAKLGPNPKE